MAPKCDQSEKDALGKNKARKSITLEHKIDILRRYDKGELTAAIRDTLNLPESTLHTIRKDREKITAAIKAGAGSCFTKVSSASQTSWSIWRRYWSREWITGSIRAFT